MNKIATCLWFDNKAEQAVELYTSVFKNSKVGQIGKYSQENMEVSGKEAGSVMTVAFNLEGQEFLALNGGPVYSMTPAISFVVSCTSGEEIEHLYKQLSDGGFILMELNKYPFSEKFAWFNDKFGTSWQLTLQPHTQKITPALMFVGGQHGRAQEAIKFYTARFENSRVIDMSLYPDDGTSFGGTVKVATFALNGQNFMAMDSPVPHAFTFTPGTSFLCLCESQAEVDQLWQALCDGGTPSHCGWLSDKFGISWQIVPSVLIEMMKEPIKSRKVTKELLQMSKINIEKLELAYRS